MSEPTKEIAFFDFDKTLIKGDSLWPFLVFSCGRINTVRATALAIVKYVFECHDRPDFLNREDIRTYVKATILCKLLNGFKTNELKPSLEKLSQWLQWNTSIRAALLDHHNQGHLIVIASGGLNLYLPYLVHDLPYDKIICTEIEVLDDIVTGKMVSGNCVRSKKAERILEFLKSHGPFTDSWGYGNSPDDLPMLDLFNHRTII